MNGRFESFMVWRALLGTLLFACGCQSVAEDPKQPAPPAMVLGPQPSQSSDTPMPALPGPGATPTMSVGDPRSIPDAATGDEDDGGPDERDPVDAGPWVPPDPTCVEGDWLLAPGLLPAKHVDYIADRDMRFTENGMIPAGFGGGGGVGGGVPSPVATPVPYVISSAGMACANARDRATCQAALMIPTQLGRHLVTTSGDSVRTWAFPAALQLLGEIDTPAEAIWVLLNARSFVGCDIQWTQDAEGFLFENLPNFSCSQLVDGGFVNNARARVTPNGTAMDIFDDGGLSGPCPIIPPGMP